MISLSNRAHYVIGYFHQKEETDNKPVEKPTKYFDKTLKVRVVSAENDNVTVNLPIKLVKAVLKAGHGKSGKIRERYRHKPTYLKQSKTNLMDKLLMLNQPTGIPFQSSLSSDLFMMYVKVKTKDVRFAIPVPYALLNIVISILSSKLLQKYANKWTKEYFERKKLDFTFPLIDKEALKPIVLVDVKAQDGTEVKVRL